MNTVVKFCQTVLMAASLSAVGQQAPLPLRPQAPFAPGEQAIYDIHYGPVYAGRAYFTILDSLVMIRGRPYYSLAVVGKTLPIWDWFYKVRDYYVSIADTHTLRPLYARRKVYEGGYTAFEQIFFNHEKGYLIINDSIRLPTPSAVYDLLSMVYLGRRADFSRLVPGQTYPLRIVLDGEVLPVSAQYVGTGTVSIRGQTYPCYIVKPKLVPGRVFKEQDDMTVYISRDERQVVLRIESAIFVGYIQADLASYRPGHRK